MRLDLVNKILAWRFENVFVAIVSWWHGVLVLKRSWRTHGEELGLGSSHDWNENLLGLLLEGIISSSNWLGRADERVPVLVSKHLIWSQNHRDLPVLVPSTLEPMAFEHSFWLETISRATHIVPLLPGRVRANRRLRRKNGNFFRISRPRPSHLLGPSTRSILDARKALPNVVRPEWLVPVSRNLPRRRNALGFRAANKTRGSPSRSI